MSKASLQQITKQFLALDQNCLSIHILCIKTECLSEVEFEVFLEACGECLKFLRRNHGEVQLHFICVIQFLFCEGLSQLAWKLIKENSDFICFGWFKYSMN